MRSSLTRAVAAAVLLWAVVSAAATLRNAAMQAANPVTAIEAQFRALAPALPPSGTIGFLEYGVDDTSADHLMVYYAAQYALAPRLVEKRTDLEFLVVARDALRPGVDERLSGFELVTSSTEGHRLYRRRAS